LLLFLSFQVKHSSAEDTREGVYVSSTETHELTGSRGTANFTLKWTKDSKHESYLNVQEVKNVTRPFTSEDHGKFVPIIGFECRGLEPVDWRPEDGFIVKAPSGTVWEDVDLSEKEWADYDEKSGESVSIMELEWEFRVHKEKK
jgi:hypothetical protein